MTVLNMIRELRKLSVYKQRKEESTSVEVKKISEGLNSSFEQEGEKRINEFLEEQKENRINKLTELKKSVEHHEADQMEY